jgi:hypothetical protein
MRGFMQPVVGSEAHTKSHAQSRLKKPMKARFLMCSSACTCADPTYQVNSLVWSWGLSCRAREAAGMPVHDPTRTWVALRGCDAAVTLVPQFRAGA